MPSSKPARHDDGRLSQMAPKGSFFPLVFFLLLPLSSLLVVSLYRSSLPLSSSSPSPTTFGTLRRGPDPSRPNFTLTVKVLAYNRLPSLSRCLRSLSRADYCSDKVNLHILVDHFKVADSGDDLDKKLAESRRILEFLDGFSWGFGEKAVHYRTGNVGLQAQWLEAWWPVSDHEFAFVVEDDLEVSPLYYKFLKGLIVNYYYNASNFSPSIYGASLQRARFVPGKHGNKIQLDEKAHIFLYQLVGTWGQLLFPRPWKEFRLWYDAHKAKGVKPILQGMVTTRWYKKMGERIWTPWFIKFIHSRGYFNLYTSFPHRRALSVSHRDTGVNYGKTAGPDSYLLDSSLFDEGFLKMQPLSNLKWYDFCFREVLPDRVVRTVDELGPMIDSVQILQTVLLISLYGQSEMGIKNLLCHFQRLNIRNYIFMGPKSSSFLRDLARRGHPVIEADELFESTKPLKSKEFEELRLEVIKEILAKAYFIQKSLEYKCNTWVLDGNLIPLETDFFIDSSGLSTEFQVGKRFEFFFIRSTHSSSKAWTGDFITEIFRAINSKWNKGLGAFDYANFVLEMATLLEPKGVKVEVHDHISSSVAIFDLIATNRTALMIGKKIVYWPQDQSLDLVRKRLEELGLWVLDEDFTCTSVICHPS